MTFPCYPKYKASGFIWLGDVPENWALKRLGHYFDERREKASDAEFEPLSVTKRGIVPRLESAAKTQDGDNRKKVLAGDFVINSRSDRKGSSGLSPLDGSVSLICTILIPAGLHGPFIHHLFRSELFQEEYYRWGKGIVADLWSTNFSDMKNIVLGVPSEAEQTQIARFLDHETARIDALIEEQKRLVELLKEKRQAVISHAVTKGIDPTVPMKDSGVEWLGEVPVHWHVTKLGWVLNELTYGFTNPMPTEDWGPAMLTANDIGWGTVLYDQARSTSEIAFKEMLTDKSRPRAGDLLLTKDGTLGRVAVHDGRAACINQSVALLRPDYRFLDSEFLCSLLQASCYQTKMIFDAGGTTIKHIYITILAKMNVAIPPLDEQQALLHFMNAQTGRFDRLISEAEQVVALLQERRSALISAAVTGKIDVRGWQPPTSAPTPELAKEAV